MITKARLLQIAEQQELLPTTVEKDYVLGWLLHAIANHDQLSRWVFKGGTCLKKCFFETYRFSEDLDFTIPNSEPFGLHEVRTGLSEIGDWVSDEAGITFPPEGIEVEIYENKRGKESMQAKITYNGPLQLPRRSLQRVKFDLTQDEVIADTVAGRQIFHPYEDALDPAPLVTCYSANEILAEKTRALVERQGRARDVYDLVHLSRHFRDAIDSATATRVLREKFTFKGLPEPSVQMIMQTIDEDVLKNNWEHQLAHQLPHLPPIESFLSELRNAVTWWLEPGDAAEPLPSIRLADTETILQRQPFPVVAREAAGRLNYGHMAMNRIRYASHNHLCSEIVYHRIRRLVEPYSLRRPGTGNTLLYVYERQRGDVLSGGIKAFKVDEIESATVTNTAFSPRYLIEL